MTLGRTFAVCLMGVEGAVVECEADLADGLPGLTIVGLPDLSLHEARDRVKSAIGNSKCPWPTRRITLALLPATLPKSGSAYDLAIAVAILCADGVVPQRNVGGRVLIGELGLDGRVRSVMGVLPMVLAAARAGWERFMVPAVNLAEAALVPGIDVVGVSTLREAVAYLAEGIEPVQLSAAAEPVDADGRGIDMSQVAGQTRARRAMEIAAAGGHHCLLVGPPGGGKTMLAERLPGLLPDLSREWALEVSAIHSVAGLLSGGDPLVTRPPFRAPHHTITRAALVGGGSHQLRPGELSCAHRGVLLLDEAPEFGPSMLDCLRQPLEEGIVRIARARGTAAFPARVTLVLAANPCACASARADERGCVCTPTQRRRYLGKLSGPLLDRVDLSIHVDPVSRTDLMGEMAGAETTAAIAARVAAARDHAAMRLVGTPWQVMGEVPSHELRARWPLGQAALTAAARCLEQGGLSARGFDKVVRVAWTIADLAGKPAPGAVEVGEALSLRTRVAA